MDELPAQVSGVATHDVRNTISKKFPRQAACLSCRRSKTRCIRGPADINCQRCRQNDTECLVPDFHVGRRKGVKNKRSGLDKVVHQLEKAIKSSQNYNVPKEEGRRLQQLLSEAENLVSEGNENPSTQSIGQPDLQNYLINRRRETNDASMFGSHETTGQIETDDVALDDAENPLQLLARASDLADTAAKQRCMPTSFAKTGELRRFFGPFQPRLDVGSDIDPVNIGLVTEEEVTMLIE